LFLIRQKTPIGLPPDFKKVVGDYESSTVIEGEDAVNRKFAPVLAIGLDLVIWTFGGWKGFSARGNWGSVRKNT
jgi:hypothetical protein